MVNEDDYVCVSGDFITYSTKDHSGYLTNGVLELKCNLLQKTWNSYYNFRATGNHKLILSGENFQTVTFENSSSSGSSINNLEIANTSEEGVEFSTKVVVKGEIVNESTSVVKGGNLYIAEGAKIKGNIWPYDLALEGSNTLNKDFTIGGNLYVYNGDQNLNGHTVQIGGDLIQDGGKINISKGKLLVKGDYRLQTQNANLTYGGSLSYLIMSNEEDYVLVEGDFVTQTYYSHENLLNAGVLEIKGDFLQKITFFKLV